MVSGWDTVDTTRCMNLGPYLRTDAGEYPPTHTEHSGTHRLEAPVGLTPAGGDTPEKGRGEIHQQLGQLTQVRLLSQITCWGSSGQGNEVSSVKGAELS